MLRSRHWLTRKISIAQCSKQINFLNKNVAKLNESSKVDKPLNKPQFFQRKAIFRRPVAKIPSLSELYNTYELDGIAEGESIFDEKDKESIISASKSRKNLAKGLLPAGENLKASFWESKPFVRSAEWLFPANLKESTPVEPEPIAQITEDTIANKEELKDDTEQEDRELTFPIFIKEILSKIPESPYKPNLESTITVSEQLKSLRQGIYKEESSKALEKALDYYPGIERKERLKEVETYRSETFESLILKDGNMDKIDLLIKQRALEGNLNDCLEILNKVKIYGLQPTVNTFNNVLLCTCVLKNPKSARFIYLKMISESITPDLKTFSILIKTHVVANDLNSAFALQKKMERDGIASDVVVFSTLIDGLVNNNLIDRAWETYNYARTWRLIEPDQVLFTIMIKACYKNGETEKALNIYDEMTALGLHPTDLTYTFLIKAMGKRKGFMDKAFHFYNLMKCEEMPIGKSVYQHLIKCCGRNGVYSRAELVLNEYTEAGFNIEEIDLYHLIMSMKTGIKVKELTGASIRNVFERIRKASESGISITSITLNGLIDLYQSGGFYKYAIEVLDLFPHFNAVPTEQTYQVLLEMLGKGLKEPGMFFNLWKLMRDSGITPSRKLACLALDVAIDSGSSKTTLGILREMYSLRFFPTPNLTTKLYKHGKHIVEIHLAVKDLMELQKNMVKQKCEREKELVQSYIDERQLKSYAHGKQLKHETPYHSFRKKSLKAIKLKSQK